MPGGALACVLPPRKLHAWPSLGAGHSVRGLRVSLHGATRGSYEGRGIRVRTRRGDGPRLFGSTQLNIRWTRRSWQGEGHADRCGVSADRAGR